LLIKQTMKQWRKNKYFDIFINIIEYIREIIERPIRNTDFLMTICAYWREILEYGNCKFIKYPVKRVEDYCRENHLRYLVLKKSEICKIKEPQYFEEQEEVVTTKEAPDIYIAELKDARITSGNSYIISEGCCLYDLATYDVDNRYDLRYEALIKVDKNIAVIAEKSKPKKLEKIPVAISLSGLASYNYFHITIEILSRLINIDQYEEYREFPILFDDVVKKIPQYQQLLERINQYNHPCIYLKPRESVLVERLIYPSYHTWMPVNIRKHGMMRPEDFLIADSAVFNMRNTILKTQKISETYSNKKIFISRRNNKMMRLMNEASIAEIFKSYGFEILYPEDMDITEQIRVYSHASILAGATGAAFTNIIYAPQNAKIICIIPKEYHFYLFSTIAHIIGQECIYLSAKVKKKGEALSDDLFYLDEKVCARFLQSLQEK